MCTVSPKQLCASAHLKCNAKQLYPHYDIILIRFASEAIYHIFDWQNGPLQCGKHRWPLKHSAEDRQLPSYQPKASGMATAENNFESCAMRGSGGSAPLPNMRKC